MIKAVLFDFDDTLGDRNGYAYLFYQSVLEKHFKDVCEDKLLKEAILQDMMMWEEKGDTNKNYPVEKACEKYQLIFPEGEDFHEDFKNRIGDYSYLFDGALELIVELKKKYQVGLLTNGDAMGQRKKVSHAVDMDIFDYVFISGDTPYRKPQKEMYEIVLKATGLKPEEIVMVGDNFANDIYGALRMGMDAIWVTDKGNRLDNVEVKRVESVLDIRKYLQGSDEPYKYNFSYTFQFII